MACTALLSIAGSISACLQQVWLERAYFNESTDLVCEVRPVNEDGDIVEDDAEVLLSTTIDWRTVTTDPEYVVCPFQDEELPVTAGEQLAVALSAGGGTEEGSFFEVLTGDAEGSAQPYTGGSPCRRVIGTYSWSCGIDAYDVGFVVHVHREDE